MICKNWECEKYGSSTKEMKNSACAHECGGGSTELEVVSRAVRRRFGGDEGAGVVQNEDGVTFERMFGGCLLATVKKVGELDALRGDLKQGAGGIWRDAAQIGGGGGGVRGAAAMEGRRWRQAAIHRGLAAAKLSRGVRARRRFGLWGVSQRVWSVYGIEREKRRASELKLKIQFLKHKAL